MRGIIVKPTLCCRNTSNLGKIVQYRGKDCCGLFKCFYCKKVEKSKDCIMVDLENTRTSVDSTRVKWFNDDLDKEIQEEDTVEQIKEKEGV